jgi:CrcB protein
MVLLVGIGGALGAALRYQISISLNKDFPSGTLLINVIGSLILGLLFGLYMDGKINNLIWMFFGVGFSGAFTTFSTFSFEIVQLFIKGRRVLAIIYLFLSIALGLIFSYLGMNLI